ncbi:MAG: hypothetical protein ABR508_11035 [Candidatus Baltobacteraceae bacterium]
MLIPDEFLDIIDSVAENRTAFMVDAALVAARRRKREILDAEVEAACREMTQRDRALATEWEGTLGDGLSDAFDDPYAGR